MQRSDCAILHSPEEMEVNVCGCALPDPVFPRAIPSRSPPLELGVALLEEGGDALLFVLRAVNGTDEERLELEPGCQIHLHAAVHGALDERKAERRTLLVDLNHSLGFHECIALGCQAIDEADAVRLFCRDGFSCEQDL